MVLSKSYRSENLLRYRGIYAWLSPLRGMVPTRGEISAGYGPESFGETARRARRMALFYPWQPSRAPLPRQNAARPGCISRLQSTFQALSALPAKAGAGASWCTAPPAPQPPPARKNSRYGAGHAGDGFGVQPLRSPGSLWHKAVIRGAPCRIQIGSVGIPTRDVSCAGPFRWGGRAAPLACGPMRRRVCLHGLQRSQHSRNPETARGTGSQYARGVSHGAWDLTAGPRFLLYRGTGGSWPGCRADSMVLEIPPLRIVPYRFPQTCRSPGMEDRTGIIGESSIFPGG